MPLSMRRFGPLSNGNRFSGRVMMAICRASAPNWWNAVLSSSALSNKKEIERWVLVGTHPADGATKKFGTLSVNVEIGRRNDGQWCSEFRLFGPTLPCRTTGNFVQEPAAPAPRNDNTKCDGASGTGQVVTKFAYLRAAQAYMFMSIPTGTSTIFGVFQAIENSQVGGTITAPK